MVLIEFKENLYTVYLDLIEVVLRKKTPVKHVFLLEDSNC